MGVSVRHEVLVTVPTRGRLWRLGDLRNMLEAVGELPDDYEVIIQGPGVSGHSMRFLEPMGGKMLTDAERITAVENIVNGRPDWNTETTVEAMDLSVRTYNLLKREGINTIGDLIRYSPNMLNDKRNFGSRSVDECADKLALAGFSLLPNDSPSDV